MEVFKEKDNLFVIYNNIPQQVYYDENQDLKASTLWFLCSAGFADTEISKDGVYTPTDYPPTESQENNNMIENGEN